MVPGKYINPDVVDTEKGKADAVALRVVPAETVIVALALALLNWLLEPTPPDPPAATVVLPVPPWLPALSSQALKAMLPVLVPEKLPSGTKRTASLAFNNSAELVETPEISCHETPLSIEYW